MADVENRVPCHPDTVMRIASISKSMTMAVVAKLWQDGKLDLDKPVQYYVPSFPKKTFNKEEVTITTRQLVSHLAGVRHYKKPPANNKTNSKQVKDKKSEEANSATAEKPDGSTVQGDSGEKEFYIRDRFATIQDALKLFKDDDLMFKPGTSFLYTTHGWTLISAVVEAVASEPFTEVMRKFFQVMGLKYTYLDEPEPLIYNRSRYYSKNARGRLNNVPYVDVSLKWAGSGFLSTVGDLLRFGNAMLYSYQWRNELEMLYPPGYLKAETMQALWTPQPGTTSKWGRCDGYGMGWFVVPSLQEHGGGDIQKFSVGHTGGAVGASSVLLIVPNTVPYPPSPASPAAVISNGELTSHTSSSPNSLSVFSSSKPVVTQSTEICIPCGVTVAIIMNLQNVGLQHLAMDIAALFRETQVPVS
ncbi:serine beta-lactamase-like protein LACTB, mitochondrial isoform X2 [Zootermopsis nevadensis]|nr:serine beta-lactamase-like protein LACTB, mitochondrial isoform X2 [Zootermopsis nevadensis]